MALEAKCNAEEWHGRIKWLRVMSGMTQSEAARKIGVELRTYQRWEKGENHPEPNNQEAIATALGSTVADIFTS